MASTAGTLSTAMTGNNNDLDFTAKVVGPQSSKIKIQLIDPGVETASESVAVTYANGVYTIAVTLRSVSSTLSTAAQVAAAIAASEDASALVTVANKAANDGTGNVTALAATALSAGTFDATTGGYDDIDEMEDSGWKYVGETATGVFVAEILLDGCVKTIATDDATSILRATAEFLNQLYRKGDAMRLATIGAAD